MMSRKMNMAASRRAGCCRFRNSGILLPMAALTSIPPLEAGDSVVWWHCDVIHPSPPSKNQQGWGNVMYIPAAPM
ncbi:DUF1479 family protein [Salmonella enterica subsp. enterica]|nr:DUF1479 family protein [Salmonella enterica subsp. enterica]